MEQEHHGKLMFIVLGLIALIVIVLGIVAVLGGKKAVPPPVTDTPIVDERQQYIDATTSLSSSSIDDPEVHMYNRSTSAPGNTNGSGNDSQREIYEQATTSN